MAAVWDDPENDELYRAQVRGLLADLHGFSNRMTKFGRLFGDQTTARIDLSRPVDFDISALAQSGDVWSPPCWRPHGRARSPRRTPPTCSPRRDCSPGATT